MPGRDLLEPGRLLGPPMWVSRCSMQLKDLQQVQGEPAGGHSPAHSRTPALATAEAPSSQAAGGKPRPPVMM